MTKITAEVVILGGGPGGYTAAFRAADLLKTGLIVLVERYTDLGGVCLNAGCIPSKYLLHTAQVINEAQSLEGVVFGPPQINLDQIRAGKDKVVGKLKSGLMQLVASRKIQRVTGVGQLVSSNQMVVTTPSGELVTIDFKHAIIAAGSQSISLPFLPNDPRIMNSTHALELTDIPKKLLIIGAGIIGLELSQVYAALGSKITMVEVGPHILAGVDTDLSNAFYKTIKEKYTILLNTQIKTVRATDEGLWVRLNTEEQCFDKILLAVGRSSNGAKIGADKAGVQVDARGFITVDKQMRTNIPNIFAIGDVVGQPMLAHKAIAQAKIAAEVIAGKKYYFEPLCIPNVAYTDPEVAWVGLSEIEAKAQNIPYEKAVFPWAASGRALSLGKEGLTKIIFDSKTRKILGAGIVGSNAGDLIAEVALAIEMGAQAEDVALTIHPHPTLSETIVGACEIFEGSITDLPNKK